MKKISVVKSELPDAEKKAGMLADGECVLRRVSGVGDEGENLSVRLYPVGIDYPVTVDLELDDFPIGTPLSQVLAQSVQVDFFLLGEQFVLVARWDAEKGSAVVDIHSTFTEGVVSGVGVVQKPVASFAVTEGVPVSRYTLDAEGFVKGLMSDGYSRKDIYTKYVAGGKEVVYPVIGDDGRPHLEKKVFKGGK